MSRPYALHRCHACHAPVTSKRIAGTWITVDYYAGTRHMCGGDAPCAICGCDRRNHNAEEGFCRVCRAFGETDKARHQFQPTASSETRWRFDAIIAPLDAYLERLRLKQRANRKARSGQK